MGAPVSRRDFTKLFAIGGSAALFADPVWAREYGQANTNAPAIGGTGEAFWKSVREQFVMPPDLVAPITRLAQNLFISPSALAQHAAVGAFDDLPSLLARVDVYRRNRDRLIAAVTQAGLEVLAPDGRVDALRLEPIARLGRDEYTVVRDLLRIPRPSV